MADSDSGRNCTIQILSPVNNRMSTNRQYESKDWCTLIRTERIKVPLLKEVNFGKVKLWDVEHFWTLFVFTFGRDCYCIQQSRPKIKTKSVQKCSTSQSFILPKWHSFKIGTLRNFGSWEKIVCYLGTSYINIFPLLPMTVLAQCNDGKESLLQENLCRFHA